MVLRGHNKGQNRKPSVRPSGGCAPPPGGRGGGRRRGGGGPRRPSSAPPPRSVGMPAATGPSPCHGGGRGQWGWGFGSMGSGIGVEQRRRSGGGGNPLGQCTHLPVFADQCVCGRGWASPVGAAGQPLLQLRLGLRIHLQRARGRPRTLNPPPPPPNPSSRGGGVKMWAFGKYGIPRVVWPAPAACSEGAPAATCVVAPFPWATSMGPSFQD